MGQFLASLKFTQQTGLWACPTTQGVRNVKRRQMVTVQRKQRMRLRRVETKRRMKQNIASSNRSTFHTIRNCANII